MPFLNVSTDFFKVVSIITASVNCTFVMLVNGAESVD